jgi:hypothetical protein
MRSAVAVHRALYAALRAALGRVLTAEPRIAIQSLRGGAEA